MNSVDASEHKSARAVACLPAVRYAEVISKDVFSMQRTGNQRSGFSILEGLLVIFVIAVLGVSSWAVYQRLKTSASTTEAAGSAHPSSSQQSSTTTTPAPTVAYLTVKEWGIKLPLSDAITDAYYVPSVQNRAADGTPLAIYIGLKSLDAAGCNANSANVPGGVSTALGTIIRVNPTDVDHVSGVEYVKEYPSVIIGNYAYVYGDATRNRTCASATSLEAISSAFTNAIQTTTAATAN